MGRRLLIPAVVAGEGPVKAVPIIFRAVCEICGAEYEIDFRHPEYSEEFRRFFFLSEDAAKNRLRLLLPRGSCKAREGHRFRASIIARQDYRWVRLTPLLGPEEAGERERSVRGVSGILFGSQIGAKAMLLDAEVSTALDGELILLAKSAHPLEERGERPGGEDLALAKAVFGGKSLGEVEALIDAIIAPSIRGRSRAKLCSALSATSVKWIKGADGGLIPGCMRVLFIGDPRTGKGMILRWFSERGISGHAVGETSSRTGLIYNIDNEKGILSWGVLPLNDGGMVCIEGLHGLPAEEMSRFREALAQMRVEVHRRVEGVAWCRTRIVADLNPRRPMDEYLYPCLALLDNDPFRDPADLTRWDLAIPFYENDVEPDVMYGGLPEPIPSGEEALKVLIRLAWSLKADEVLISDEAYKRAVEEFKKLKEEYETLDLPLIHNGTMWSLLRIAASIAILELSLKDGKLLIEEKQVEEASMIIRENLEAIGLGDYKASLSKEVLGEDEYERIREKMEEEGKEENERILIELGKRSLDSEELAGRLGCSSKTVKRKAKMLKGVGLIRSGKGGYSLTKRGIQYLRMAINTVQNVPDVPDVPTPGDETLEIMKGPPENRGQKGHQGQGFREGACELCGYSGYSKFYKVKYFDQAIWVCEACYRKRREWTPA
jgi:biotin operon repressor